MPVGRAWATLVEQDGAIDFLGNTIDLFPEHRGRGSRRRSSGRCAATCTRSGSVTCTCGSTAHDVGARRTFLDAGAGVADVHLRKDLT